MKNVKEWEYKGIQCIVVMQDMGHLCGYVAVGENHPWFGLCYDEPEGEDYENTIGGIIDVHGGVTFASGNTLFYQGDRDLWWFGFDCMHCDDNPIDCDLDFVVVQCEFLVSQLLTATEGEQA